MFATRAPWKVLAFQMGRLRLDSGTPVSPEGLLSYRFILKSALGMA